MPISEQQRLSLLEDLLKLSLRHHKEGRVRGLLNVPIVPPAADGEHSDATTAHPTSSTTLLEDITVAVRHIEITRSSGLDGKSIISVDTNSPVPPPLTRAQVMEQHLYDRREDRRIIALGAVTFSESDDDSQNGAEMSNNSRPSSVVGSSRTVDDLYRELQISGGGASRRSYDENAYRNEEFFRTTSISPTALDNVGAFVVQKQRDLHHQKLGWVKEDAVQEAIQLWTTTAAARIKRNEMAELPPPPPEQEEDQDGVLPSPSPATSSPTEQPFTMKHPVPLSAAQRKRRDQEQSDEKAVEDLMWDPSSAEITPTVPTAHATKNRNAILTQGYDPPDQVVITLLTGPVMHKPQGIDEKSAALKHQGYYCKSCLRSLKKSANPLRGWDAAVFCFYTGYYFCEQCHDRTQLSVIPARVVRDWDFSEHMVSSLAHTFLDIHRCQTPMLCVSAINPALYDKIWLLRMVRELRVELTALNAVGLRCKEFRKKFYSYGDAVIVPTRGGGGGGYTASGPRASALQSFRSRANSTGSDASSSSNRRMSVSSFSGMHLGIGTRSARDMGGGAIGTGGGVGNLLFDTDNDAYIPVYKRYLVMDSECWTLEDLEDIHQSDPDNIGPELVKQWEEENKKEMLKLQQKEESRRRNASKGGNNVGRATSAACINTSNHHPLTAFAGLSPLVEELLNVRRWFLRHILKECVDQCLPSAVHACRACSQSRGKDLIMSILPSASRCFHYCTQCHCYYHLACWRRLESEAQKLLHAVVLQQDIGLSSSHPSDNLEDGTTVVVVCPECRSDAARAAKLQRCRNLW